MTSELPAELTSDYQTRSKQDLREEVGPESIWQTVETPKETDPSVSETVCKLIRQVLSPNAAEAPGPIVSGRQIHESFLLKPKEIIRDKWQVLFLLGCGGYGQVYKGFDFKSNIDVAIKVECLNDKEALRIEMAVLKRLQGTKHVTKFYGHGRNNKFNYVVMEMVSKNLAQLKRNSPLERFSEVTSLRLAYQAVEALQDVHSIGFIHRDVKPSNFAVGLTQTTFRNVFVLDFGLARQYMNSKGQLRPARTTAGFRGTVRYASITSHKEMELGRQDDLISIFYMMVEMANGSLPWRHFRDKSIVKKYKETAKPEELCCNLPLPVLLYWDHVSELDYNTTPDYELLQKHLRSAISSSGSSIEGAFDWELEYAPVIEEEAKRIRKADASEPTASRSIKTMSS